MWRQGSFLSVSSGEWIEVCTSSSETVRTAMDEISYKIIEPVFHSTVTLFFSIIYMFFFFSMTREERTAVFQYWLSAVEVEFSQTKLYMLILVSLSLFVTFIGLCLLPVSWSESFESLSSESRPLDIGVFGFRRAEGTGGKSCLSGCDTRCDSSAVNLNSSWIIFPCL